MPIPPEYKNLHLATIAFGTSSTYVMQITGFDEPERTSQEIADQDLTSNVAKSFAGAVIDEGELNLTCRYQPGTIDPINLVGGLDEVITITYPLRTDLAHTVAAKKVFTGHVMKAGGIKAANDNRCERQVTIQVNSAIAFTAGS